MVFSPLFLWELWAPTYNWLLAFWAYFEGKSPGLELGQPEVVERVGQVGGTRTLHRISLGHPDRGVESWWCQGPWHVVGDLIFWVLFVCFICLIIYFLSVFLFLLSSCFVEVFELGCNQLWQFLKVFLDHMRSGSSSGQPKKIAVGAMQSEKIWLDLWGLAIILCSWQFFFEMLCV